jgi:hypothetical protein
MNKYFQLWPIKELALSLTFLFFLVLITACGTGADSFSQPTQTVTAKLPIVGDTTTSVPEGSGTATSSVTSGFDCASVNQIPPVECEALVALFKSTNGPGWIDNSGWLATDEPCSWSGIECSNGHIRDISLGYNQLTGILPRELGNLSHLHVLGLSTNQLHGLVPEELGNLLELISLDLSGNQLTDPLPARLGSLVKLRNISLAHNKIGGAIPAILAKMKSLDTLNLSHNQFSGPIPEELGNLAHLTQLYLSHNHLSGPIPATLGNLSKLFELDLSYNQLSGPVPEFIPQISDRSLWGNQFEGTVFANGQEPFTVDYLGIRFSADPSLANSIWPEVKPDTPLPEIPEGPSYWLAIPEHLCFTFANPGLSLSRRRMGFNLAPEAQILVFPLTELVEINPLVQTQIETLRNLLAERGAAPSGELPLLPLTNSAQVFHAQVKYLNFGQIQGLRFISQHSQDPHPIMLSPELFYTFQGFTNDGGYYVAAFFPLTTAALPDEIEMDDWEAFHAHYDTYLSETTAVLDQLQSKEFTPGLTLLDAVVTSLRVESDNALFGESTSPSGPF